MRRSSASEAIATPGVRGTEARLVASRAAEPCAAACALTAHGRLLAVFPDPPWRGGSGSHMRDLEHLHALVELSLAPFVLCFSGSAPVPPPPAWLARGATLLPPVRRPDAAPGGALATVKRNVGYLLRDRGPLDGAHRPFAYPATYLYDQVDAVGHIARAAREVGATAVLLRSWFLPYAQALKRQGLTVFVDAHDAQARAAGEIFRTLPRVRRWLSLPMLLATRRMEPRYLDFCDEVWAPSAEDVACIRAISPGTRCVLYPNLVPLAEPHVVERREADGDAAALGLLFVGNMSFLPNARAAEFLVVRVLPALRRRRPGVVATIVGPSPPAAVVRAAAGDPRLVVTGRVPDVADYYRRSAIAAVPLWQGSGTKVKLLEAFSFGKAVVATPKAVEGIDARDGEHLLVADDCESFVAALDELFGDPALRRRLGSAARRLVERRYAFSVGPKILAAESLLLGGCGRAGTTSGGVAR